MRVSYQRGKEKEQEVELYTIGNCLAVSFPHTTDVVRTRPQNPPKGTRNDALTRIGPFSKSQWKLLAEIAKQKAEE